MKVLVTGGAGFIGSSLVEELINRNHDIIILDNLSTGRYENIHLASEFVHGDIRESKVLEDITRDVDCIFHLAAFVSVPASIQRPDECYGVNIDGTLNVIKAAGENGVRKIIFSSSCAVYDGTQSSAINENCGIDLVSPYARSKYEAEQLLSEYSHKYNFSFISLRYFNVFGERQDPGSPYSAVIPKFISRALGNEEIVIYDDGEQTRDFIYVKDVVNANITAMESSAGNELFNVGTGKSISVNHLAKLVIKECNSNSQIKYEPEMSGDTRFSLCDISKITGHLGWEPEYEFEDALVRTIEWYKRNEKPRK